MKRSPIGFAIILILLAIFTVPVSAARLLIPGGQVIGIRLEDGSVTVGSLDEDLGAGAKAAGLAPGDRIVAIDDRQIRSAGDVRAALQKSDGTVTLSILRSGQSKKLKLCPVATADGPKLGVFLKEGTTGVGTVTYYDPAKDRFGALGHGVHDPAGQLLAMKTGSVYSAAVLTVKKGAVGAPGQLMGAVTDTDPLGDLGKNTTAGIFGTMACPQAEPLPTGDAQVGGATIRSTIDGTALREYSVEILKIYPGDGDSGRNMLLRVTDPQLLDATGGIVQGMSGSPIIQNGKLVGAVTHVLVNDPTTGYGIFIENMLNAAA